MMTLNNYKRYLKIFLFQRLFNNNLMIELKKQFFPNTWISSVSASKCADKQQLIFHEETFTLPTLKDIFGNTYKDFIGYNAIIPSFYVRCFSNAFCFTDKEYVFASSQNVVAEYTSQKKNPYIGYTKKIFKNVTKIDASVANLSLSGLENNYYHFLTECIGRLYLLEKSDFKPDYYIVANHLSFQSELLELLGIDKNKIISTNSNMLIQAKEIIIPDFINNWEYVKFRGTNYHEKQWVPHWINKIYIEKVLSKIVNKECTKRIYISRSKAKYRKILNEENVVSLFMENGFTVHNLEGMSVTEQIGLFCNASIIAGIHGAGLINMNFAPKEAIVFEIYPEYYHDSSFRIQSTAIGLKYHYLIGETTDTKDRSPQSEDVFVDINKLERAIGILIKEECRNV